MTKPTYTKLTIEMIDDLMYDLFGYLPKEINTMGKERSCMNHNIFENRKEVRTYADLEELANELSNISFTLFKEVRVPISYNRVNDLHKSVKDHTGMDYSESFDNHDKRLGYSFYVIHGIKFYIVAIY